MLENLKDTIKTQRSKSWYFELKRLWWLLLFALFFVIDSSNRGVVLFALAVTSLTMAVAHITRKLLFPYFDMGKFMRKSLENPIGAAIVTAAVLFLIATLINATVVLLK